MEFDFEAEFASALSTVPGEFFDESRYVPGAGPMDADLVFVGEAPGAEEVREGLPFVGNAGRRLDSLLDDVGIDRTRIYVTNVVKVRPPENRDPSVAELDAWRPVLEAELERVDPAVIVSLGNVATRELLDTDEGITEVRGKTCERAGAVVVPTFHPASTFYDESKRETIAADLQRAVEAAGVDTE